MNGGKARKSGLHAEEMLDQENDRLTDNLAMKVSSLKSVCDFFHNMSCTYMLFVIARFRHREGDSQSERPSGRHGSFHCSQCLVCLVIFLLL